MYISGIDWPGDPGNPVKAGGSRTLVMALVTVRVEQVPAVAMQFREARRSLGWSEETPFHFMESDERSRNVFFDVLRPGPVRVIVRVGDKQDWFASRPRGRAADLLNDLLVDLVLNAPEEYIAGRIIQIDRPRSEAAAIRDSQSMIRKALAANGVRPGPTPKAVPDHRPDAYLIPDCGHGGRWTGCLGKQGSPDHIVWRGGDRDRVTKNPRP
jgi:hypothetical protein